MTLPDDERPAVMRPRCAWCDDPATVVNHYRWTWCVTHVHDGHTRLLCPTHHVGWRRIVGATIYDRYLPILEIAPGSELHVALECAFAELAGATSRTSR